MSIFNFPNQRIPEGKKNEEWHKKHILNYLTYTTGSEYAYQKKEIARLYHVYSAILTPEQDKKVCAMITERYGENFGPKYMVYPLAEQMVEQLVGEYRQRPLKRKCLVNNEKAVIKKLDKKVDYVTEQLLRGINEEAQSRLGFVPETENPEIQIPDDIQEFFEKDYRTLTEEVGEDILYQLLIVNKEKEKIYDLLRGFLIAGRVFAVLDMKEGHPSIFCPHILDCFYDMDPHKSIQNDPGYFVFDKYIPVNDIFNMFPSLTEDQKKAIEDYSHVNANSTELGHFSDSQNRNFSWFENESDILRPRVVSMQWVSRKKMKFKSVINKNTGREEYKILPKNYRVQGRDEGKIKTIEVDDIRHITMIGPDIVLSYGSLEDQLRRSSDMKKRFTGVVGLIDKNNVGTGEIRSLVKKLEDLQDFASEILYEIRLSTRQMDGNVMVYDLANMPKEFMKFGPEKALEKVQFFLKRDRIQFINSRDKRANPYASSVNVSQKSRLNELMSLLALIEDLAEKITGISKERRAQAGTHQKATVAEINMTASGARTEEYFGIFDSFTETLLERMILKAKHVYDEHQTFTYFGGDNQAKFLTIFPDFFVEDLGVHIGDNRKEFEKSRRIEGMAEAAFGQGSAQTPEMMLDLLKIYNADGSTEKEAVLRKGVKALEALRQENMKMAQEQQQAELQQKAQAEQGKNQLTRESHQKDIQVAHIYANNKADDTREKEMGQNRRKLADIEKDLIINDKQNRNRE